MDYDEWLRSFRADKVKPVYVIASQEYFLTRRVVERVRETLWEDIAGETNYQRLDGSETSLRTLLEAVSTIPFFGSRRLVVLEGANLFVDKLKTQEREELRSYLSSPALTATLVMIFDADDRRKWSSKYSKWAKEAGDQGDFVDCKRIYENQIPAWIKRIADHKGMRLSHEVLVYLTSYLRADIQTIYGELEKLEVHAKMGRHLTLEEVRNLVGDRRRSDIFVFQHQLGGGLTAQAMLMLDRLLDEGEEGIAILNRIYTYFKQLLRIKELDEQDRATPKGITKITNNRSPKINQQFIEASRRYTREDLLNVFPRLLDADREMKTGGVKAEGILPPLVLELCKGKRN